MEQRPAGEPQLINDILGERETSGNSRFDPCIAHQAREAGVIAEATVPALLVSGAVRLRITPFGPFDERPFERMRGREFPVSRRRPYPHRRAKREDRVSLERHDT